MRVLITGGAGFVGSHLAEAYLADGHAVTVVDDLSAGRREWVPDGAGFIQADLTAATPLDEAPLEEVDLLCHLASRKLVDTEQPRQQFRANTQMTYAVREAALNASVDQLLFTSSSTVYGEAPRPTPETHGPPEPISDYGASKLACEGALSVAAHTHELSVVNVRFANIVGSRLRGAVIPDFIRKLREDPDRLEILGDGRQQKSYMHVSDCVAAMRHLIRDASAPMATYNLGTRTTTAVDRIAEIVAAEMGLDPIFEHTGGERGWAGDVPRMRLSIEKLAEAGWEPRLESDEAVRQATRELTAEL